MTPEDKETVLEKMKKAMEGQGIPVYPISAVSGEGIRELLFAVKALLDTLPKETVVFEPEYDPQESLISENLPFTVELQDGKEKVYVVEGPKIEKMLGFTNLDSEKGFAFFQRFLKEGGILDKLEEAGIQDGDTVRIYGFDFDYYK